MTPHQQPSLSQPDAAGGHLPSAGPRSDLLAQWVGPFVAGLILFCCGAAAGWAAGRTGLVFASLPGASAESPQQFALFQQAWDLVQQRYVDRSALDPTKLMYGAIEGMLGALGDSGHTRFLTPQDLKDEQQTLSGQLQGIGAELEMKANKPTIVAPLPGSPAQQAGVQPGDVIVQVDGQTVSEMPIEQIVNLVHGPAGSQVTLSVLHPGDSQLTNITITRADLTVPSVTWAVLPGTSTAHILLSQFADQAKDQLVSALASAQQRGATSVILDLRNDPGGLEPEAISVASQFLSSGNVLLTQDSSGKQTPIAVQDGGVATHIPLVVLINNGTASSAEIVAGALQDQHRAELIGQTTFGTGTVLSTFNLSDGSALLLGTEEWLTPNGREIWHHGIQPDDPVTLPASVEPELPEEEASLTPDQVRSLDDTQLEAAIQALNPGP